MRAIIEVQALSKLYRIPQVRPQEARSLRHGVTQGCLQLLHAVSPFHTPRLAMREYWALRDVSFTVHQGENLSILGHNGSGKTTLLRILSRISMPTAGRVRVHGRPASLLQAGTGFHPELSGRENVYMNGMVLGMSRNDIRRQFDAIVAFSGVEPFIDTPLKYYSTGMQARLGFAVASHLDAPIMLLDEGLASGDREFRAKSIARLKEMGSQGRTLLFVSHDPQLVREICSRAIMLDQGRLIHDTTDFDTLPL